jgi:hypothetical protein
MVTTFHSASYWKDFPSESNRLEEAGSLPGCNARALPGGGNRSKAGETVLFMDGVHFVQAAFLGYLWCFTRIFLRSPSGRKLWNVPGACNAISEQWTVVVNDGDITAATVCEMLRKLSVQ